MEYRKEDLRKLPLITGGLGVYSMNITGNRGRKNKNVYN
jgi:hypothetical protein